MNNYRSYVHKSDVLIFPCDLTSEARISLNLLHALKQIHNSDTFVFLFTRKLVIKLDLLLSSFFHCHRWSKSDVILHRFLITVTFWHLVYYVTWNENQWQTMGIPWTQRQICQAHWKENLALYCNSCVLWCHTWTFELNCHKQFLHYCVSK